MLLPKGDTDLRALSESITERLSLIAATMADTEKTPPDATKPITNSLSVESEVLLRLPVAASASTADSKTVGANWDLTLIARCWFQIAINSFSVMGRSYLISYLIFGGAGRARTYDDRIMSPGL